MRDFTFRNRVHKDSLQEKPIKEIQVPEKLTKYILDYAKAYDQVKVGNNCFEMILN